MAGPPRKRKKGSEPAGPPPPPKLKALLGSPVVQRGVRAAIVILILAGTVMLIGPERLAAAGLVAAEGAASIGGKLTSYGATAITRELHQEVRALTLDTPTPKPTRAPTRTPVPPTVTATTEPIPTATARTIITPVPQTIEKPNPLAPPPAQQLDTSAAANAIREYFKAVSAGQVERALQFWMPEAATSGRTVIDTAISRKEKYNVKSAVPRVLAFLGNGVEVTVVVDVTDANGKVVPDVQHKYQMRTSEGEWYITARML